MEDGAEKLSLSELLKRGRRGVFGYQRLISMVVLWLSYPFYLRGYVSLERLIGPPKEKFKTYYKWQLALVIIIILLIAAFTVVAIVSGDL
jgi:hypothetical protein